MPAHVAWFPVAAEKYAEELESVHEEQLRDATSDTCPSVRGPVPSLHGKEREVTAGQAGSREVTSGSVVGQPVAPGRTRLRVHTCH